MAEEKSQAYIRAERRAESKLGFYKGLTVYLAVNLLLFIIDLLTSPGEWWFYWPLLFWGIGVFFTSSGFLLQGNCLGKGSKKG